MAFSHKSEYPFICPSFYGQGYSKMVLTNPFLNFGFVWNNDYILYPGTPVKNIGQLFKIASNCLESAQTIFNTAANEHREFKCSYNSSVSPKNSPRVQTAMSVPDLQKSPYAQDVHKQRQLSEVIIISVIISYSGI